MCCLTGCVKYDVILGFVIVGSGKGGGGGGRDIHASTTHRIHTKQIVHCVFARVFERLLHPPCSHDVRRRFLGMDPWSVFGRGMLRETATITVSFGCDCDAQEISVEPPCRFVRTET